MVSRIRSCLNYCFTKLKRFFPRLYNHAPCIHTTYLIVHHGPSIPNVSFVQLSNMGGGRSAGELPSFNGQWARSKIPSIDTRETYLLSRVNCEFSQDLSRYRVESKIIRIIRTNISKRYLFSRISKEFCELLPWIENYLSVPNANVSVLIFILESNYQRFCPRMSYRKRCLFSRITTEFYT